jgi:hypothetical protein
LELLRNIVNAGPSSIEGAFAVSTDLYCLVYCVPSWSVAVTSFVRADRVPQLADADEVCARLQDVEWAAEARASGS